MENMTLSRWLIYGDKSLRRGELSKEKLRRLINGDKSLNSTQNEVGFTVSLRSAWFIRNQG